MDVGVQGESGGEVTVHTRHGFDVHAVLECKGCEGVAGVVEAYLWEAGSGEDALEHIMHTVR